jgi:hypothetical protein
MKTIKFNLCLIIIFMIAGVKIDASESTSTASSTTESLSDQNSSDQGSSVMELSGSLADARKGLEAIPDIEEDFDSDFGTPTKEQIQLKKIKADTDKKNSKDKNQTITIIPASSSNLKSTSDSIQGTLQNYGY